MEIDRLVKMLIPTLVVLALLAAIGHISTIALLVIAVVVSVGAFWAFPKSATIRKGGEDESVDTAVAAAILNALPDPIILLDGRRNVVACNNSAVEALGEQLRDRDLSQSLRQPDVLDAVGEVLAGAEHRSTLVTLPFPVSRKYELHAVGLDLRAKGSPRAIVALHDVSSAMAAEQMRADFVANVSHELRSPLSSLLGFIETLKGAARDDAEAQSRFLNIMEDEASRMSRLINDLLSLSKVESLEHVIPEGEIEIAGLLAKVRDSLSSRAAKEKVSIDLNVSSSLPPVVGAADEMAEVFHNLIDNAIKYGGTGGTVSVTAALADRIPDVGGAGIEVSVTDQGEGIEPELINRLTERFYRVDKGRSRSMGGTGLGLAIVKHIVNRHRGRLVIKSTPGQGSAFTVYLPVQLESHKSVTEGS